ncbi:hypothetical protein ACTXT7_007333 [Hymenolepis weldensis]
MAAVGTFVRITVGTSVRSALAHPPIISSIDFCIPVEIIFIGEKQKTLLFFWIFENLWQEVVHSLLRIFVHHAMPCTLLTDSGVLSESAER